MRDRQLHIRVSTGELEEWGAVASAAGLALSEWVRIVCEAAAEKDVHTNVYTDGLEKPERAHKRVHAEANVHTNVYTPRASRERRMMCEHRILPGAYCRLCDRP